MFESIVLHLFQKLVCLSGCQQCEQSGVVVGAYLLVSFGLCPDISFQGWVPMMFWAILNTRCRAFLSLAVPCQFVVPDSSQAAFYCPSVKENLAKKIGH